MLPVTPRPRRARALTFVPAALAALSPLACKAKSEMAPGAEVDRMSTMTADQPAPAVAPAAPAAAPPAEPEAEEMRLNDEADKNELARGPRGGAGKGDGANNRRANKPEGPTRAWFPETFLFEPLVVTDDDGNAQLSARVPDRLTSWRVLALAHSRAGAQAGAVTSFLGTLPIYVDPVVPKVLMTGDEVRVPIQVVNTSEAAITTELQLEAQEATISEAPRAVSLAAGASRVEYARLKVGAPGMASLRVTLGKSDAVLRTIQVMPTGKPVVTTRTGTLAAPRTLTVAGTPGADPGSDRVRLQVFPGALAILRSELGVCTARTGLAEDAYALLLAGRAPQLLAALGDEANAEALRELSILATQRTMRHARQLGLDGAILLTEAALAHPQNPVLQRLGTRAAEQLARAQLPDGTFAVGSGNTLQRVLVTTAEAVRAIAAAAAPSTASPEDRKRASAAAVRAAGAFERNLALVEDAYTAAAILASGAVTGKAAEVLRAKVRGALKDRDDGAKVLPVAEGVVRGDGQVPSELEATALAVLALAGDAQAPLADLGASLIGGYSLLGGWGDGRTNLVAMRAVLELFKTPVPSGVTIRLLMDGEPVASGKLEQQKLREVLVLEASAAGLAQPHQWQIIAEPAVPGLGYALSLHSYVPWDNAAPRGLELRVPATMRGAVGKPLPVELTAVAPSGMPLRLRYALPAGAQADPASLQPLVDAGTIERFTIADDAIELWIPALAPGQLFAAKLRVIPTLAGTLHSGASSLVAAGADARFDVPPSAWTIE